MKLRTYIVALSLAIPLLCPLVSTAAERAHQQVTGYVIHADLDPVHHQLTAHTAVTFTALDDTTSPVFELHNALRITKLTDAAGHTLTAERSAADSTVRVALPTALAKGKSTTLVFEYSGILSSADDSPVEGLKLAFVGDPISYLLYAGRWFPVSGYLTDRFTAEIHVRVPSGITVVGSGGTPSPKPAGTGLDEFDFNWTKSGFPGTLIAAKFLHPVTVAGEPSVRVFTTDKRKDSAVEAAQTASKEFDFFTGLYGPPDSSHINIVELPEDTVPAFWAPEIAAVDGRYLAGKTGARLIANTISRQWWGQEVSPATLNDAWITNGMARYSEVMYLEDTSGKSAMSTAIQDISAGALAYDTIPLANAGRLAPFSPEFQSMTLEKGAMVFHMLRWEVGDEAFKKTLRGILSQFSDNSVRTSDVEKVAEAQGQQQLGPFFAQWLSGTGAPQFDNKFTVYRLGNNKGFSTVGQISQDLDLFRMPVDLRIETEGRTENRRIDVVGTDSPYAVETFGRPRHIMIDPDNWVLKNTSDMKVRVAILRGQQLSAQGDYAGALAEFQKALDVNHISSLASYRVGEVFFQMHNYQSSANSYRDALRGDDDPKWTEVWSHIQLGKIFDATGQRDRAVNEYRQAVQTNDNTQGALNEARKYLQTPYKPEGTTN
ncbi:MAG TPA: M1 family aminopeptidase [Acidobacteriaceae bacterium]|nr:M1 family aminopeptidase [Acidobacteriaceae bacterium]